MTKRIKDFGAPIGGRRRKKNTCILGQDAGDMADRGRKPGDPYSYMGQADRVGEENGVYETRKKQLGEPDNRKRPLPYSKLDCVNRTGPKYLAEGRHADENDFKELGIKGVEFGASLSDEEAQSLLDECYLAFCDLARVLGIDKKEVSLGGTLSLAFASRGNGGSGPATYDPKHHVINFTREGGAGSLAREWAHALDYYIGQSCGLGAASDEVPVSGCLGLKGVPPSVKALLWGMSSKREKITPEEQLRIMKESYEGEVRKEEAWCREMIEQVTPENLTDEQRKAWNQAVWEVYDTRYGAALDMYVLRNCPNRAIEELSRIHKEITGHVIPRDKKRRINYHFASLNRTEQVSENFYRVQWKEEHTKFFRDSWELHERYARTVHGRHCDNCERMARAFECYVADKLEQEGNQSQYLTAHSGDVIFVKETGEKVYGSPVGREREEINQMFDKMFWELKKMGILHYHGAELDIIGLNRKESGTSDKEKFRGR